MTNAHKTFLDGLSVGSSYIQPDRGLVLADTDGSSSEDELGDLIQTMNPK